MSRTYYDVLGVDEDASQEDVESAYRERVKETHPDRNDEDDAADQFREVVRAEEVLGDADERSRYDELGHDAYVRRVDGVNAAGAEQSPWTATPDDTDDSCRTDASTSESSTGRSTGSGTATGTADTTAEHSAGSGETARERREAYRAARHVREDVGDGESSEGYTVHDWEPGPVEDQGYQFHLTQERVFLSLLVFVLYPVFVYSSVTPQFSPLTNVTVAACTLLVLAYLLTIPEIGIIVFGTWSVLGPIGVVVIPVFDPFSTVTLLAILATWVPLGYSVAFARITRA
jgi:hypothetical protein